MPMNKDKHVLTVTAIVVGDGDAIDRGCCHGLPIRPKPETRPGWRSSSHLEHYAKACFAAHHAVVSFGSAVQRVFFDQGKDAAGFAEPEGVFGVDRGAA